MKKRHIFVFSWNLKGNASTLHFQKERKMWTSIIIIIIILLNANKRDLTGNKLMLSTFDITEEDFNTSIYCTLHQRSNYQWWANSDNIQPSFCCINKSLMLCQCFRKEIPFLQAQNSDDLLCVIEDMNITYPIENNSPCGLTKNFTLSKC